MWKFRLCVCIVFVKPNQSTDKFIYLFIYFNKEVGKEFAAKSSFFFIKEEDKHALTHARAFCVYVWLLGVDCTH